MSINSAKKTVQAHLEYLQSLSDYINKIKENKELNEEIANFWYELLGIKPSSPIPQEFAEELLKIINERAEFYKKHVIYLNLAVILDDSDLRKVQMIAISHLLAKADLYAFENFVPNNKKTINSFLGNEKKILQAVCDNVSLENIDGSKILIKYAEFTNYCLLNNTKEKTKGKQSKTKDQKVQLFIKEINSLIQSYVTQKIKFKIVEDDIFRKAEAELSKQKNDHKELYAKALKQFYVTMSATTAKDEKERICEFVKTFYETALPVLKKFKADQVAMVNGVLNRLQDEQTQRLALKQQRLNALASKYQAKQDELSMREVPEFLTQTETREKLVELQFYLVQLKLKIAEAINSCNLNSDFAKKEVEIKQLIDEYKLKTNLWDNLVDKAQFNQDIDQKTLLWQQEVAQKRAAKKKAEPQHPEQAKQSSVKDDFDAEKTDFAKAAFLSLNANNQQLIRDIINIKTGVKFSNVESLVKNQLGGKVKEIGNGSSHKRLVLKSYNAKGVMVLPHGKAHNSGELSLFNLTRVAECFARAGFNRAMLDEIDLPAKVSELKLG